MNKETKRLIPKLRFPEFEGEWEAKSIEKSIELISGIALKSNELTDDKSGTIILRGINITEGYIRHSVDIDKYYLEDIEQIKGYLLKENDIVIGMDGSKVGKNVALVSKQDAGSVLIQRVARIRAKKSVTEYLYQHFLSQGFRNYVDMVNTSSGIPHISAKQIRDYEISFPPTLGEQQKIASCLSSLDELITAHNDKLEALKAHKKGLMQNLFPQEGEKVPKYRFPEFEKEGEWSFESLSEVYSFLVTNSFSREKLNYDKGKVKNIHYGDIHTKFSTLFDISTEKVPYVNLDISLEKINTENYCKVSDIVFADASEDLDDIGKSIEVINLNQEKLLAGLHTLLARQIDSKLAVGFGGYLFKSAGIREQIKREAQGTKVLGISRTRLLNIRIYYPKNKSEQQKIASCLSSLDALITAQTEKIEQLRWHKKGLMQGLFPKIEE